MLDAAQTDRGHARLWLSGAAASALLLTTSWLVHAAVAYPRVAAADVVARLNEWLGDAETRDSMRQALGRMSTYRSMIDATLHARGLPLELLSMALAESGFESAAHPDTPLERRSAGIWQIIPSTGRKLGLEVSAALDERLDPSRATEAAAEFLVELYARYVRAVMAALILIENPSLLD